ncbi:MAG: biopolymer transporter ExbD [Scytolyngbya sp. HA4215-MV1]|jgi:biopolymer transport protein ExbD|nr:biopolymer transporter ExbD [Scytolyngbya sp. HA4215-MV1]
MRLPEEPELPPQINIVPMIDVIFAILTFFIMSTLFLTRSEGLSVNLPKATTAETQQESKIVVTIDQQGQLSLNRQPIDLNSLTQSVQQQVQSNQSVLVIINADERVTHGRVIAVMDQLRMISGVKLAIAAERP